MLEYLIFQECYNIFTFTYPHSPSSSNTLLTDISSIATPVAISLGITPSRSSSDYEQEILLLREQQRAAERTLAGVGAGGPAGRAAGYGAGVAPGGRFLAARESGLRLGGGGEFGVGGRGGLAGGGGGGGGGGNVLNRHPKFPAAAEEYPPGHLLSDEFIDTTDAPVEYLCPISTTLMADPVIAADGFSYERANIEGWIRSMKRNGLFALVPPSINQSNPTLSLPYPNPKLTQIITLPYPSLALSLGLFFRSPTTDEPLEHVNLIPNQNLRLLISNYRRAMAGGGGAPGGANYHYGMG